MNGLSICIPVYNYNCINSVKELCHQIESLSLIAELLVVDDASSIELNDLQNYKNPIYSYEKLRGNIGRSKIRNFLVKKAKFDCVLFIDGDSKTPKDFIKNYITAAEAYPNTIIYGGTIHNTPTSKKDKLRYNYGVKFEYKNKIYRNKKPYHSFRTNNFFSPKYIVEQIPFNEKLNYYGQEDTFFGYELKNSNIDILHIENPVIHLDSDSNEAYLAKTKSSIENLIFLKNEYPDFTNYHKLLSLIDSFSFLKTRFIKKISKVIFKPFWAISKKTSNPYSLQLFKIFYILSIYK